MYKVSFFVPVDYCEPVKDAMFSAGAGKIGNYDSCSFQTLGEGSFRPLEGSDAFIGSVGHMEKVQEYKVEMVCDQKYIHAAIQALIEEHPYETPAYDVLKLESF